MKNKLKEVLALLMVFGSLYLLVAVFIGKWDVQSWHWSLQIISVLAIATTVAKRIEKK